MKPSILCATFGLAACAACAPALAETTLTVDDFTAGAYHSAAYKAGGILTFDQTGATRHVLGGTRTENLYACTTTPTNTCTQTNPYGQYASFAIGADKGVSPAVHALVMGSGFDDASRLELVYGQGAPMAANLLLSPAAVIRVRFQGLAGPLNFNVEPWTASSYVISGCNLDPNPNPFVVELPLTGFSSASGFSWGNVNTLALIFQLAGSGFGITSVEVSDTPGPGAITCAGGTTL